ncbi:hypothetical protein PIB30_115008, partial [Stylosanthes scabra]|nr:hypothetical protein [Stylosanthes scabra]
KCRSLLDWTTYSPNIHNNNNSQEQALQASYEDANTALLDSLWHRCQSRAHQFPAWPEPFDADFVLGYLLEQEINNL